MDDYRDIFRQLMRRGIVGFPALIGGFIVLFSAVGSASRIMGGALGFIGCMLLLVAAGFLAHPIARLIAEPSRNLFFPNKHHDRPQPNYAILEAMRKKKQYSEAMDGYRRIIEEFPQAGRAYIEMIDIAIHHLQEPERAERIYCSGLDLLEDAADRRNLEQMWAALRDGRTPEQPARSSEPARNGPPPDDFGQKT
ncbi:hypothetical protein ACFL4W_01685 [Planctomycetota bacterium]